MKIKHDVDKVMTAEGVKAEGERNLNKYLLTKGANLMACTWTLTIFTSVFERTEGKFYGFRQTEQCWTRPAVN